MSIFPIGSGYVPLEEKYAVSTKEAISKIRKRLKNIIDQAGPESEEAKKNLAELNKYSATDHRRKSGIFFRQYRPESETTNDLAWIAVEMAINNAMKTDPEFNLAEVGLVLAHSSLPADAFPSTSSYIINRLRLEKAEGTDLLNGCSGGVKLLIEAYRAMIVSNYKYVIVVATDKIGSTQDLIDKNALLWGDNAGAIVLKNDPTSLIAGITDFQAQTILDTRDWTRSIGYGSDAKHRGKGIVPSMEKRALAIFRFACDSLTKIFVSFSQKHSPPRSKYVYCCIHNMNAVAMPRMAKEMKIMVSHLLHNTKNRGNQSSAGSIATYAYYDNLGYFRHPKSIVYLFSFGSDMQYAIVIISKAKIK